MSHIVNTKQMLLDAQKGKYAVPAFNIHNMETVQAVVETAVEMRSPVIIAATPGTMDYAGRAYIQAIVEAAAKENDIPIALHLDHHETIESIETSLELGTKSVMIDGSHSSFEENIALTKQVVDLARKHGATVEAELGKLVGQEDDLIVTAENAAYTDPDTVEEFVERTGIDSLAVAIGTGHGVYETEPKLDFERLDKINKLVDVPIVLHGASGISKEDVQKCIELGCCKVNISTELKIPFSSALREFLIAHPEANDPRKYMTPAKEAMKAVVREKIDICMSEGKA